MISFLQAYLSLRWAHMPFCWFCHEAAQMKINQHRSFLTKRVNAFFFFFFHNYNQKSGYHTYLCI